MRETCMVGLPKRQMSPHDGLCNRHCLHPCNPRLLRSNIRVSWRKSALKQPCISLASALYLPLNRLIFAIEYSYMVHIVFMLFACLRDVLCKSDAKKTL